ncbi:hypothetical protein [Mycolicibacterium komossense]|uniref:DUF222 domain-containing protein n=1 Tax=Mycolicibacterium komossense TaxID=1779 RepID=A0ABT3C5T9_9MYCO|nr:hypothetical protein [Mycolicibacterium komossense]MCV7224824.1 hypothetical protein [Mycolicibacterium komossense]
MTGPFGPTNNHHGVGHVEWTSPAAGGYSSQAPLLARLTARLLVTRYDRLLANGATASPHSAIGIHARRLVTVAEREAVARSLRQAVEDARTLPAPWTGRSWAHRPDVLSAVDLVDTVTLRLHSPRPVTARGMAKLRLLLSDGMGPLYVSGRGDLGGRLRSALAAM